MEGWGIMVSVMCASCVQSALCSSRFGAGVTNYLRPPWRLPTDVVAKLSRRAADHIEIDTGQALTHVRQGEGLDDFIVITVDDRLWGRCGRHKTDPRDGFKVGVPGLDQG